MRVLVTGATGFAGQHLVRLLLSREYETYGTYLSAPAEWGFKATLVQCDLREANRIRDNLDQIRPQHIYHLAAQSSPSQSLENPRDVYETNFGGMYNLLEAARQVVPNAQILVVGSGQCYGEAANGKALIESMPLAPTNPYGLSKAAADMLAGQYHSSFGLHVVRVRPFNHTGPGQQEGFVCSDYARRIAAIEVGDGPPAVRVRDAGKRRDFTDVRDVVRAYELLMKKGRPGEAYNIASGRSISVGEIASMLASFCSRRVHLLREEQPGRPGDVSNLYGSSVKLRRATGWKPRYNMRQTLRDLFENWKIRLSRGTESVRASATIS